MSQYDTLTTATVQPQQYLGQYEAWLQGPTTDQLVYCKHSMCVLVDM